MLYKFYFGAPLGSRDMCSCVASIAQISHKRSPFFYYTPYFCISCTLKTSYIPFTPPITINCVPITQNMTMTATNANAYIKHTVFPSPDTSSSVSSRCMTLRMVGCWGVSGIDFLAPLPSASCALIVNSLLSLALKLGCL